MIVFRNFRQWWQPPRDIAHRPDHRQVTFLELFYDLVYVVLIAELTHALASHIDLEHIGNFLFLFVIVWWAWINGTIYHDIHGNNDIRTRMFTFMQMFCVASMAVFAHDALGDTSVGFALSYAAFQLILTYMWWRTGVHDPNHRPLSTPYTIAFLLTTTLFIISVFVEAPLRFYLWAFAVLLSVTLPITLTITLFNRSRNNPVIQNQLELSRTATASLVERFGLFTIIVLGEVIVAVVQGVAEHHGLTLEVGLIGGIGMAIAIGLWWLYFDFVSHRLPHKGYLHYGGWLYTHLSVTGGIAVIGASVLNVVEHAGEPLPTDVRWLLVIAIALTLAGIALLIETLQLPDELRQTFRIGQVVMLIAGIVIFVLGFTILETLPLLIVIIVLMLAPVFFGFLSWIKAIDHRQETQIANRTAVPNVQTTNPH